jgi:hypothetical protein
VKCYIGFSHGFAGRKHAVACCVNLALSAEPLNHYALAAHVWMLKGKVKGIYLRGELYWFGKQVSGRRSIISLETRDDAEAVQRVREIMERPALQPAQALTTEVERFLKHKSETNRFSKMSAQSKGSILRLFAESVKNIPPAQVTTYQCKAFYNSAKARVAPSAAESYMFTVRSFFNWCVAV